MSDRTLGYRIEFFDMSGKFIRAYSAVMQYVQGSDEDRSMYTEQIINLTDMAEADAKRKFNEGIFLEVKDTAEYALIRINSLYPRMMIIHDTLSFVNKKIDNVLEEIERRFGPTESGG